MRDDLDRFEIYYADRLWSLMPEIYRTTDTATDDPSVTGPLRELCNRIGAQMAVVRRSVDRLWDDQSIESCDDWVVPYIGDLLATNLVNGTDSRSQRREVAKTIYYRRRKGTAPILEEIAHDVTGWDARVVEFFRRLARTRHGLDPAIGLPSMSDDPSGARRLQLASGLVGPRTGTVIGGTAALRDVYGASKSHSAFDEFFYTVDVRRGEGNVGWYNIPRLGVFLWRLASFPESEDDANELLSVPVAGTGPCKDHFTFDPTGRTVPLFLAPSIAAERYGAKWTAASEWQLPGPLAQALLDDDRRPEKAQPDVYASSSIASIAMRSVGVFQTDTDTLLPLDAQLQIWSEYGQFATAPDPKLRVWYHYGFSSRIGAGAYDRRPLADAAPAPGTEQVVSGGAGTGAIAATSTVTYTDSLTYTTVPDVANVQDITIRSRNKRRPLIRPAAARGPWTFHGSAGAKLRFEGVFLGGGCDVVLTGQFDEVTISFSTLDPGQAAAAGSPSSFANAIDGRVLASSTLWIEASVGLLTIDRSITGPVRVRRSGVVQQTVIRESIVQQVTLPQSNVIAAADVKDVASLAMAIQEHHDPISTAIRAELPNAVRTAIDALQPGDAVSPQLATDLRNAINTALAKHALFAGISASRSAIPFAHSAANADPQMRNRALLADSFPLELADLALAFGAGEVTIDRSTILGASYLHRLAVSESILDDLAWAEDPQQGCVRFSAWKSGSVLPRKYESVESSPGARVFTSRAFGQPGYAQLRSDADAAVIHHAGADDGEALSIREGAQNGIRNGCIPRRARGCSRAPPADQVRRVHAARVAPGDRACDLTERTDQWPATNPGSPTTNGSDTAPSSISRERR